MRIGIDLMGSDRAPIFLFDAVIEAAEQIDPACTLLAIATHPVLADIKRIYQTNKISHRCAKIEFYGVTDFIAMAEEPVKAVVSKKESSIVVGIKLLKQHRIDAFISAGNTGALIATSTLQLPKLPGIRRPALLVDMPTAAGSLALIDVGGSVSYKMDHLIQFAYMGAAYQSCSKNIVLPSVGLLNIGVESKKGNTTLQQAYQMLQKYSSPQCASSVMRFIGNVEATAIFNGNIDVLVTDGFAGNVLLKTSEGLAAFIFNYLNSSLKPIASEAVQQVVLDLQRRFSYAEYQGAIICGVDGLVMKCHGYSTKEAIINGIKGASNLIERFLITKMKQHLAFLANP